MPVPRTRLLERKSAPGSLCTFDGSFVSTFRQQRGSLGHRLFGSVARLRECARGCDTRVAFGSLLRFQMDAKEPLIPRKVIASIPAQEVVPVELDGIETLSLRFQ